MEYDEIEDAIITQLEPLKSDPPVGIAVKGIASYAGEFATEEQILAAAYGDFPAVFAIVQENKISDHGRVDFHDLTILIYCADQNTRGARDAKSGTYALIKGVRNLLHKKQLGGTGPFLRCVRESALWYFKSQGVCVFLAEYQMKDKQNS